MAGLCRGSSRPLLSFTSEECSAESQEASSRITPRSWKEVEAPSGDKYQMAEVVAAAIQLAGIVEVVDAA